jgi:hypothetical protein
VQLGCLVQPRHNHGGGRVFSKIYQGGGRVILKHDTRGRVVLQNDCLGCTVAPSSLVAPDMFPCKLGLTNVIKHSHLDLPYTKNPMFFLCPIQTIKKGSQMHVASTCARSEEGYDHFGSYVRSLSLHFYNRLFPRLEPMISWSQGNIFTVALGLPFTLSKQLF